ncbi:hypothetical protein [Natronorubrum bangense]|uniref:Uncharacterized protein n=2 Tax=Natronorubrum bangense TaxID=61858 RepID=L9WKI9_9EURY|nr:hypothetical protein [Natronorubrum bangense]ELY49902.1 hypothetical protein C494_07825 [Natronorubrum bangense JCM 10635]QCC55520.1 hypothetical protein DV706_14200 [Natronorubrum bangense]
MISSAINSFNSRYNTALDILRSQSPFSISGNGIYFGPHFVPERIQIGKERNLVRHANFCGLEDVFEIHGKNREIHVSGKLRQNELQAFENVLDHNQTADLITPGFSGEIRVVKGEYEGPIGWDPMTEQYLWSYNLDLVSTGLDEAGHLRFYNKGVVDDGRSSSSFTPASGRTMGYGRSS